MMGWLVLVLRVALGCVFLAAGGLKVGHADVFAGEIAGFQLLWHPLIAPLALLLPFLELMVGVYLIIGLYTRFAAWLGALEMAVFSGAIASAVLRGISTSCGCFGPADKATTSWPEVVRDLGFAAIGVVIALWAPGALALDRRIHAAHDRLETQHS
jgi:uncharacterized membrane protein YphA (DoxX/SURF4 family)